MVHYPAPFDEERTRRWIDWNLENYAKYGFGLWAAVLKETGKFIGDCGLTLQNIDGEMLPEIGYHIHKKYWRRGFAKEAAQAVRDWTFLNTKYNVLYSYMKYTNEGSWRTAMANGMKKVKEYPDPKNTISYAFCHYPGRMAPCSIVLPEAYGLRPGHHVQHSEGCVFF